MSAVSPIRAPRIIVTDAELALLSAMRDLHAARQKAFDFARMHGERIWGDNPTGDQYQALEVRVMDLSREAATCLRMAGLHNLEVGAVA